MIDGIRRLGRLFGIKPAGGAEQVRKVSKKPKSKVRDEIEIKPEHIEAAKRMEEVQKYTRKLLSQQEEVDPDTVRKYRELLEKDDFLTQDRALRIAQELTRFLTGE